MAALKLSKTLIIIIAVSGFVGCLVILFVFFRYCRRAKSAPLPPIQPLAHHREKESNYLLPPPTFRSGLGTDQQGDYNSDSLLLRTSRKPSFQTGSEGTPSSSDYSFSTPAPHTNLASQSSPLTADDEQTPTTQQYISTSRQARSVSRGTRRPRSRVISVASTNTVFTQASPRPTSIIRGAPHSAFSNVQIVLPAPLAPHLQNHMVTNPLLAETYLNSDLGRSTQDLSRGQRSSSSSQHQSHRSLDTRDRSDLSESHAPFRGRNTSQRSIQSQLLSNKGTVPSLDDRNQPPNTTSQDYQCGQAI